MTPLPGLTRCRRAVACGPPMLSEAAEFLLAALAPLRDGICVDCAAHALEVSPEVSLKATKELIASGYALASLDICALCALRKMVTRLRAPLRHRGGAA